MTRSELPYVPALDGVRGAAVLGILLFHAGHLPGGWLGVDLFFVLSGFLITSILLNEFGASGKISIARFWARRARRLLPALFVALIGVALYAAIVSRPDELARIRADGLATLFYVANWHAIYAGHEYWDLFHSPSPLDHTWSLAIEEQFYLLWPPVVYLLLRRRAGSVNALAIIAFGLALSSALWMIGLSLAGTNTPRLYYGTDTRAAATLLGAALAAALQPVLRSWPTRSHRAGEPVAWLGMACLAWAWLNLDGSELLVYRGGLFGLSLAAVAVIAGVVASPRGRAARLLASPPLRVLGIVSYGVYLWHWPIYLVLTSERLALAGWLLTAVRIGATLAVAAVSYVAIERPIRRGLLEPRRAVALLVAGTLVVCASVVVATRPPPAIEPSFARAPALAARSESGLEVLLIGDSLAQRLAPRFESAASERHWRTEKIVRWGCGIIESQRLRYLGGELELDLSSCNDLSTRLRDALSGSGPDVVLVLEGWPGGGEKLLDGVWRAPCTAEFDAAFAEDLASLVGDLRAARVVPVIATTAPPNISGLSPSFTKLWKDLKPAELEALLNRHTACQNDVRREVAREAGAHLIDLAAFVCPGGRCQEEIDGVLLRPDGVHFLGSGADLVSRWLLDRLAELETTRPSR
jgi:peptidoglycan/LPS O-acetylase OafA/YrhL/lysophospholipase L1-like esterase